jgi:hypothetical protein
MCVIAIGVELFVQAEGLAAHFKCDLARSTPYQLIRRVTNSRTSPDILSHLLRDRVYGPVFFTV